jgi:phosphate/sulfate permease
MLNLSTRGFCVEWVAALIVLVCGISKDFAIPVSTSHCQVGGLYSFLDQNILRHKNTTPKKFLLIT